MLFRKKDKIQRNIKIVVRENSVSSINEAYNRLKDNLMVINADGNKKVIQIESSISHEGKTTIASNLAVSLGFTEKKVIVVDLDFRCPKVQQKFDVSIDDGIAEYMMGTKTESEIIKHTTYQNVDVITRGEKIYNSSLVFTSEKFKSLIASLREKYDYVLLDCAPILLVSDYIHISQISDGVLLLVAYGITTRNQVAESVKELKNNNATILGTIFSMYDKKKDKYYTRDYYGNGYYYYHNYYYRDDSVNSDRD